MCNVQRAGAECAADGTKHRTLHLARCTESGLADCGLVGSARDRRDRSRDQADACCREDGSTWAKWPGKRRRCRRRTTRTAAAERPGPPNDGNRRRVKGYACEAAERPGHAQRRRTNRSPTGRRRERSKVAPAERTPQTRTGDECRGNGRPYSLRGVRPFQALFFGGVTKCKKTVIAEHFACHATARRLSGDLPRPNGVPPPLSKRLKREAGECWIVKPADLLSCRASAIA
jgi:hypothetical protein